MLEQITGLPTSVNQSYVSGLTLPCSVCTDGTYIYWGEKESGKIGRAKLDGTEVNKEFITGLKRPHGLIVYEGHIYVADEVEEKIFRYTAAGTEKATLVEGVKKAKGIGINEGLLYWCQSDTAGSGTIGRSKLDGTEGNHKFVEGCHSPQGTIGFVDGWMYWAEQETDCIARATYAGGNVDHEFITGQSDPVMGGSDGTFIYWANFNANATCRAAPNGSLVSMKFTTGGSGTQEGKPDGGGNIWWANQTGGTIGRGILP